MANQQHFNPLLFVSNFLSGTDTSSPNSETLFPSSSYSNSKASPTKFSSDSGIHHPLDSNKKSSVECKGEDDEYIISEASGLVVDENTPPKQSKTGGAGMDLVGSLVQEWNNQAIAQHHRRQCR
ncbi:hypothetical protein O181_012425 [Austropuccinia psidii MF-1]|uniref:Uncharacterized protein n=1 Tax=Austropuccinia psidii MF-1 TaxID=1389203 RepID=A0A9Q3BXZ1_9BASI|nr:hypothetical protein [Austropuccinia psidii MF-1]